jgi:cell division transport system ATP-binding protein
MNAATFDGAVVALEGVSVSFHPDQPPALEALTFAVQAGQFVYVRGASGAGKSTLLRIIYQDLRPTTGTLYLFGQDAAHMPRRALPALRQQMGVMFQDFRLLPHLTVEENVALPLVIRGGDSEQTRRDVRELLAWVGLEDKHDTYPERLSGGEQQRVSVARAVIAQPKLVVADEPTASLDDRMAIRLMYLFQELNKMGTTVLMATHNDALVKKFPHPQLWLHHGKLSSSTVTSPDEQEEAA